MRQGVGTEVEAVVAFNLPYRRRRSPYGFTNRQEQLSVSLSVSLLLSGADDVP